LRFKIIEIFSERKSGFTQHCGEKMNRQIWGMALFVLGALVVADGLAGFVQKNIGMIRWIYIGLGALLVVRGLFSWWPFRKN
jgi:hypothetical protein